MKKKVKLELVGLDGNAYSVMGAFKNAARRQGWTPEEIKTVSDSYSRRLKAAFDVLNIE